MQIRSICTNLPTSKFPLRGLFVEKRLLAMAQNAELRALNPQPYFPVLRGRTSDGDARGSQLDIDVRSMPYIPKYFKWLDGRWMARCVAQWLDEAHLPNETILDAHFGYPEGVGVFLTAKKRKLPFFITIRGLEVDLFRVRSIAPTLIKALNAANGVIAVSHSLRRVAIEAGVKEKNISVIPNGVDTSLYRISEKSTARHELGLNGDSKIITCVANLKPVKGHKLLLRAFAQIQPSHKVKLFCIGDGISTSYGQELQQLAQELDIDDSVTLVGPQPPKQVASWLAASDAFALASYREGCCNSVLEALSCGLGVVATDAGDNREYVSQPHLGYVVPTGDVDTFANALDAALQQQFDKERVAASVAGLSWDSVGQQVLKYFENRT